MAKITLQNSSTTPPVPPTGTTAIYADSNGDLKKLDSAGSIGAIGGSGLGGEVFTSSGTYTVPSGVTKVKVTCVGGGQRGGGGGTVHGGQGGVTVGFYNVSSVTSVSVTVGSGGQSNGSFGGDSSFGSFTTAGGGSTSGGTATGGDINLTGGPSSKPEMTVPLGYGRNAGGSSDPATGYGSGGGSTHGTAGAGDGIVIVEW